MGRPFRNRLFHTGKEVLRSVNGGKTEHLAGQPPAGDTTGAIAVPPHHSKVIAIAVITPGLPLPLGQRPEGLDRDNDPRHQRRGEPELPVLPEPDDGLGRGRQPGRDPRPAAADNRRRAYLAPGQVLTRRVLSRRNPGRPAMPGITGAAGRPGLAADDVLGQEGHAWTGIRIRDVSRTPTSQRPISLNDPGLV